ncbi:MAG: hypothetical protein JWO94_751 [Verrucomicrobiaceae bacterium]|nr:hypothetical protein [Verrucomicrobiaceae bacterium]
MTLSTQVSPRLADEAAQAAGKVGLEVADLLRAGLQRVCGEIHRHGSLAVRPMRDGETDDRKTEDARPEGGRKIQGGKRQDIRPDARARRAAKKRGA